MKLKDLLKRSNNSSFLNELNVSKKPDAEFTAICGRWSLMYDSFFIIFYNSDYCDEWKKNVNSISQLIRDQFESIVLQINSGYSSTACANIRIYTEHLTLYLVLSASEYNSEIHQKFNKTIDRDNREFFYRDIRSDKIEKYYKQVGNRHQNYFPDYSFNYSDIRKLKADLATHLGGFVHPAKLSGEDVMAMSLRKDAKLSRNDKELKDRIFRTIGYDISNADNDSLDLIKGYITYAEEREWLIKRQLLVIARAFSYQMLLVVSPILIKHSMNEFHKLKIRFEKLNSSSLAYEEQKYA